MESFVFNIFANIVYDILFVTTMFVILMEYILLPRFHSALFLVAENIGTQTDHILLTFTNNIQTQEMRMQLYEQRLQNLERQNHLNN